jgi:hypothetical protein
VAQLNIPNPLRDAYEHDITHTSIYHSDVRVMYFQLKMMSYITSQYELN